MNSKIVKKQEKKKVISHSFSLIELLAVMVLLVFIMFICIKMLVSTQKTFSSLTDHNKIFNEVTMVFNMMARDLQSSLYEKDKISFWHTNKTENINGKNILWKLSFISVRALSKIYEISYRMEETGTNLYAIQRSEIPPAKHNWDFYEQQLSNSGIMENGEFNNLMKNVIELKFTCFKEDGTVIPPSESNDTEYPFSVKIDITCITDKAAILYKRNNSDEFKEQNEFKFSKTVYLGNRQ